MRNRVSKKFGRVIGQHGDPYIPQMYPFSTTPNVFGTPWGKVKEFEPLTIWFGGFFCLPFCMWCLFNGASLKVRTCRSGIVPGDMTWFLWADMDDPDWRIKIEKYREDERLGLNNTKYGGTNYLASYLWEPGDPEPDPRLRMPPSEGH